MKFLLITAGALAFLLIVGIARVAITTSPPPPAITTSPPPPPTQAEIAMSKCTDEAIDAIRALGVYKPWQTSEIVREARAYCKGKVR